MSIFNDHEPRDWLPSKSEFVHERTGREKTEGIAWNYAPSPRIQPRLLKAYDESYPSDSGEWEAKVNDYLAAYVRHNSETPIAAHSFHQALSGESWFPTPMEQLDWLAAVPIVLERFNRDFGGRMTDDDEYSFKLYFRSEHFVERANDLLLDDRVMYTFLDSRLRKREDEPLHLDLVQPLEALLTNDPRFAKAEAAYRGATRSLASGHYGEAVTSAASALQDSLRAIGIEGQTLSKQLNQAQSRNLIRGYDIHLYETVKVMGDWLTADRGGRGNAHSASTADRNDAQLAIHIAAAVMLRLMRLYRGDEADNNEGGHDRP